MVLIIDPQNAGIAGNMIAGAFVDLGVDPNKMEKVMETVATNFSKVKVHINKTNKAGIESTYLEVETENGSDRNMVEFSNNKITNDSNYSISYTDFLHKINEAAKEENNKLINKEVFDISKRVFERIAKSEAKIHGKSLDKIHFHEVGAADAVADVFGSVFGYCELGFNSREEKVIGLPIALGGGTTNGAHGRIPIPSPATLDILEGISCVGGPVSTELATPTGAALYVELCNEFLEFQPMIKPNNVGYGAGKKDLEFPNVLRLIEGNITGNNSVRNRPPKSENNQREKQTIEVIETNIDHMSGESLGYLFEKLMNEGASDVAIIPIIMKKNRPGHLIKVISRKSNTDKLISAIFRETGTLGIRISQNTHRGVANRKIISLYIDFGVERAKKEAIRFKIGWIDNEIISSRPEYEDIKKIASKLDLPLSKVMEIANLEINNYLKNNHLKD